MPVFRVTYDIVAPDKASAERHAKFVDKPNAYFKVCKVMGPRPRHNWYIYINGELSMWSLNKSKSIAWVKEHKTQRARIKNFILPVYRISNVLLK